MLVTSGLSGDEAFDGLIVRGLYCFDLGEEVGDGWW